MANTTLTQTGQQVQDAINKAEKLPTVTGSDEGKTLQVDSSGNFVANTVGGGGATIGGGFTLSYGLASELAGDKYYLLVFGGYTTYHNGNTSTTVVEDWFGWHKILFASIDTVGGYTANAIMVVSKTTRNAINTASALYDFNGTVVADTLTADKPAYLIADASIAYND